MKAKIVEALKTEYANLGLGEKAIDGVASFLEKTVTDESSIKGAVAAPEVVSLLKAIQGESDSLRTRNAQIVKELNELKKNVETPKVLESPKTEDASAKILARLENLEKEMREQNERATLERRFTSVRQQLKNGGATNDNILELVMKDASIGEGETDEAFALRLKDNYDATYTKFYGNGVVPPKGNQSTGLQGNDNALLDALRKSGKLPQKQDKP